MSQVTEQLLQREHGCSLGNTHNVRWSLQSLHRSARAGDSIVLKMKETGQLACGSARSRVYTACWDDSGSLLATGGDDCMLRIWNPHESRLLRGFDPVSCKFACMAASMAELHLPGLQDFMYDREVSHACYVSSSYLALEGKRWWWERQTNRSVCRTQANFNCMHAP
jgi:WD40 repeat protein